MVDDCLQTVSDLFVIDPYRWELRIRIQVDLKMHIRESLPHFRGHCHSKLIQIPAVHNRMHGVRIAENLLKNIIQLLCLMHYRLKIIFLLFHIVTLEKRAGITADSRQRVADGMGNT